MKTAEVAIEHILTGMLALCAFALPLLPSVHISQKLDATEAAGVLGMAYLFGVVFDRLADTILGPMEHHLRLSLAHRFLKDNQPRYKGDPFPQNALEFSLRSEQSGRLEWMDSLRSRIRTSRGLSVLGVPAAMGIAIFLRYRNASAIVWNSWPYLAVAINVLLMFLSVMISTYFKPIRTFELSPYSVTRESQMASARWRMRICSLFYFLILLNSAATILLIRPLAASGLVRVLIVICGGIAILFPWWAWRHITETHMSFIHRKLPDLLEGKTRTPRRVRS